jgi:hypothetical protein
MAELGSNNLNHSDNLLIQRAGQTKITATSTGMVVTGSATADYLSINAQGGAEGGEISLAKPPSASTLAGNVIIDIQTNSLRIFEAGGSFRGVFCDITGCASQSTLLHSTNYNFFAPTLTGGNASGTWNITSNFCDNLQRGFNNNWNADFQVTPPGGTVIRGDTPQGSSFGGPGNTWWFQQNMRHSNGASFWGVQVAWGWEDNRNRLLTRNVQQGNYEGWIEYLNTANFRAYNGSVQFGEVGVYTLARNLSGVNIGSNQLVAGSSLRFAGGLSGGAWKSDNASYAGTWRNMSTITVGTEYGLFLRVS